MSDKMSVNVIAWEEKTICPEHKPMAGFNLGYVGYSLWAERKVKQGHVQKQCPECKLWLFKCEFGDNEDAMKLWRKI